MQKISELLDTLILSVETGKQVGSVEEVLVSLEASRIVGIISDHSSWFSDKRFISFEHIKRIGFDAIIVKERSVGIAVDDPDRLSSKEYKFKELQGRLLFAESGLKLGVLADITVDFLTGELKGFCISDGIINDFIYGWRCLPLPPAQLICDDRMIVPESMSKLLSGYEEK